MKLGDSATKKAIKGFIDEAQACAQCRKEDGVNILGYAAMLTTFSCVLAVREMLVIGRNPEKYGGGKNWPRDGESIREFYNEMQRVTDERTWLLPPEGTSIEEFDPYREKLWKLLSDLRNALVHAVSMSPFVALVSSGEAAQSEELKGKLCIVVPDFIVAVDETFQRVADENPDVDWDPAAPTIRRLTQVICQVTDTGISAGSIAPETTSASVDIEGETDLVEYLRRRSGIGRV